MVRFSPGSASALVQIKASSLQSQPCSILRLYVPKCRAEEAALKSPVYSDGLSLMASLHTNMEIALLCVWVFSLMSPVSKARGSYGDVTGFCVLPLNGLFLYLVWNFLYYFYFLLLSFIFISFFVHNNLWMKAHIIRKLYILCTMGATFSASECHFFI